MTLLSLLIGGIMMVSATQGAHAGEVKEQAKHTAPAAQHATVLDDTKKESAPLMSHDMKKMCEEMKKNNPEMKQKCEKMKNDNPDMKKKCEEMKAGMNKSDGEKKDSVPANAEKPKVEAEEKNHQH